MAEGKSELDAVIGSSKTKSMASNRNRLPSSHKAIVVVPELVRLLALGAQDAFLCAMAGATRRPLPTLALDLWATKVE